MKQTALGSSQTSLDYDEDTTSTHSAMTIQEFRETLSRNEEEEEEITFMLRLPRKRWRDGSAHSSSHGRYNVSQDEGGQYTMNEARTPPARTLSGKSKILVRTPSSDQLGASTEEISSYGIVPSSPRRGSKKSTAAAAAAAVRDQTEVGGAMINRLLAASDSEITDTSFSERSSTFESPQRIRGKANHAQDQSIGPSQTNSNTLAAAEISESEQTQTSVSDLDRSAANYESGSETSNSLSLASSSLASSAASGGLARSQSSKRLRGKTMKSVTGKASGQRTGEEGSDDDKKPMGQERPIFTGFGTGGYVRSYPIRSPSDSDESFTSFARKYSRYSQLPPDQKTQRSEVDSTMDLNESFSSFASFAEDEDWAHESGSVLDKPLLEGGDNSEEEEEELSIGDQSPDSVIVDLTSVSTSANSQSLSPRSSSKASKASSLSRERKRGFEIPLNDVKEIRSERRTTRKRRDQGDGCSVGSAKSRVSNRSGGSWLSRSRHSTAQSTNSRFSRLEEYLNKNATSERNLKGSKEGGSRLSGDRRDDISTTSSLTMGTFQTRETKDSEWKKLSDVVESEEVPNPAAMKSTGITSNPSLAADRQKNVPVKNTLVSPKKTTKLCGTQGSDETKSPPFKVASDKVGASPLTPSPTKTPSGTPRKLALDRMSPFTPGKTSIKNVAFLGSPRKGVVQSKSAESPAERWSPSKTPTRASSTDAVLKGISEITWTPLSSPRKPVKQTESSLPKQDGFASAKPHAEGKAVSSSPPATIAKASHQESKVATATMKFQKAPPHVNKGINLFNPSATSTGPRKQSLPRFVGDHVGIGSSKNIPAPTGTDAIKTSDGPGPVKPSKVQSYLRRCKEKRPESPTVDVKHAAPSRPDGETVQRSPVGKKGNWNTAIIDIVKSPNNAMPKPDKVKTWSRATLSTSSHSRNSTNESRKKPSRRGPVASRPRIDQFLERHNQDKVGDDIFKEPIPSPWMPSDQCGRSRQRYTDSNSRASSMASSKCSTASRRAGALSMFQPHLSVESLPSPTNGSKPVVSADTMKEKDTKPSLVEQRMRMFQSGGSGTASKQQSARSFQGFQGDVNKQQSTRSFQGAPRQASIVSTNGEENDKKTLRLPTASEISTRVSSWHVNALVHSDD